MKKKRNWASILTIVYLLIILFATIINRTYVVNPMSNVLGNWWIYVPKHRRPFLNAILNIFMLAPLAFLCQMSNSEKNFKRIIRNSTLIGMVVSSSIEILQLVLHRGTFQVSDLVYNTLSGTLGGLLYFFYETYLRKWFK